MTNHNIIKNAVWRKLSIRNCKTGGNCTTQQVEQRQYVPGYQNTKRTMAYNMEQRNETKNVAHELEEQTVPLERKMQIHAQLEDLKQINRSVPTNGAADDLVVGSLNLVTIIFRFWVFQLIINM